MERIDVSADGSDALCMVDGQDGCLTQSEISDIIAALKVRIVDERRLLAMARDGYTRHLCREAIDRLEALTSKLDRRSTHGHAGHPL